MKNHNKLHEPVRYLSDFTTFRCVHFFRNVVAELEAHEDHRIHFVHIHSAKWVLEELAEWPNTPPQDRKIRYWVQEVLDMIAQGTWAVSPVLMCEAERLHTVLQALEFSSYGLEAFEAVRHCPDIEASMMAVNLGRFAIHNEESDSWTISNPNKTNKGKAQ